MIELPVAGHPEYCISTYYIIAMAEGIGPISRRYDGVKYGYRAEGNADLQEMYLQRAARASATEVKRASCSGPTP